MKSRKKQSSITNIDLNPKDISFERLVELIKSGIIREEIPFDFLAEYYSELLDDWYPGFPITPRKMTEEDPIRCHGRVHNQLLDLIDVPGGDQIPFNENCALPDGEYDLFLRQDGRGGWYIYLANSGEQ